MNERSGDKSETTRGEPEPSTKKPGASNSDNGRATWNVSGHAPAPAHAVPACNF
ncbi:hypothetical protein D187_001312 [Cystobacter fuscus DSM 2262]|uniref:Uncharacterized protein n=1 Tax=Cystobacter fuscus (strain ATCC 25194 / DSM 2262 / NBRC 100088 / M29) TaxID=1242864 RepID=S9QVJ4_CYSF2|nr:hypothetical protein D187_001312 [Cystobacter fuscus DSM 2262]